MWYWASSTGDVLNNHAKELQGIGPEFREPIENDVIKDEDNLSL